MYIYINDNKYKKGLKKRIINNDINLNDNYKEVVNKILNYNNQNPFSKFHKNFRALLKLFFCLYYTLEFHHWFY